MGRSGSYSTNYQQSGRELLTPDEVRLLDNNLALLIIRGERPVIDIKINLIKHPNLALTTNGGNKPYQPNTDVPTVDLSFDQSRADDFELVMEDDLISVKNLEPTVYQYENVEEQPYE